MASPPPKSFLDEITVCHYEFPRPALAEQDALMTKAAIEKDVTHSYLSSTF
jgi:hypothetical protein